MKYRNLSCHPRYNIHYQYSIKKNRSLDTCSINAKKSRNNATKFEKEELTFRLTFGHEVHDTIVRVMSHRKIEDKIGSIFFQSHSETHRIPINNISSIATKRQIAKTNREWWQSRRAKKKNKEQKCPPATTYRRPSSHVTFPRR